MGISFGSTGIKPYVGSKEVQEAYVGSQLVYRAGLPYYYYFLGSENDYAINENCVLQVSASVSKPSWASTYKIALGPGSGYTNPEVRLINVAEFVGKKLKFLYRSGANYGNIMQIVFKKSDNTTISYVNLNATNSEILTSNLVPAGTSYIALKPATVTTGYYLDAIRFEDE